MTDNNDTYPDRKQAHSLLSHIISLRNSSKFPFTSDDEITFRNHCLGVGFIAETIAQYCDDMDTEKAYVCGLLHDCGRFIDEYAEHIFHGESGYYFMKKLGYDTIARISLTHSFYDVDFDINEQLVPASVLYKSKELIKGIIFDDYDKLIQLADMLNDKGFFCTTEYRWNSIRQRYIISSENLDKQIKSVATIKKYFEQKTGKNIYDLLAIK